jgi:hypothetical protein
MMRALAALLLLTASAAAQEHPTGHDPYTDWTSPEGFPCCHNEHCRPTSYCTLPGGGTGLIIAGECAPIPESRLIPPREDTRDPVVCRFPSGFVICVALPGGGV